MFVFHTLAIFGYILALEQCLLVKANPDFTEATIVEQNWNPDVANSAKVFVLKFNINGAPEKSVILYCKKKDAFYINWESNSYSIDTSQLKKETVAEMMKKVTRSRNPEHAWNAKTKIKLSHISDVQESDHKKSDVHESDHKKSDDLQTSVSVSEKEKDMTIKSTNTDHTLADKTQVDTVITNQHSTSPDASDSKTHTTEFTEATITTQKWNPDAANSAEIFVLKFEINGESKKSVILYCNKKKAFYINWERNSYPIDTSQLKHSQPKLIAEMMKKVTQSRNPEYNWNDKTKIKLSHISDVHASDHQKSDVQALVSQQKTVAEKDATMNSKNPEISNNTTIVKPDEQKSDDHQALALLSS